MALPRTTSREESAAVLEGRGPLGEEEVVDYSIFLTDSFVSSDNANLLNRNGVPEYIDGHVNDDSYRRSRHLLRNENSLASLGGEENLRENSLARQLSSKKDQPATIRLIKRNRPEERSVEGASEIKAPWTNLIPPNTKFFLEQVQENREEKVQVIDTFGQWIAFFFGTKPEVYSYSGTLLNSRNHDWKNEFQENYDNFLRGSQAVKNRATVFLQYDDVVVEGYMMNAAIAQAAAANHSVPFQFNLLVINRSPIDPRRILGLRAQRSGVTSFERSLFQTLDSSLDISPNALKTDKEKRDNLETFLVMREFFSGNYIAPAGKLIHRVNTNNVETGGSTTPGKTSGLSNEKNEPSSFSDSTKSRMEQRNIELRAAGFNPIVEEA